ncbi:N-acetylglucosamine kinase [Actinoplanes sp. GCM10030250]|uniref:N-acetylglucosamine kinase n=1 Tax=Actinoplanes sp. GCM10030250 TaxID=3273376 RepID=UPI00362278F7
MDLVVGVDAGGTTSRAVVATLAGAVVGRGRAGPGNLFAAGPSAAASIADALRQALSGVDPRAVAGGVLGLAGSGVCADPAITAALGAAWESAGLNCPRTVVGDAITAFAGGTSAPSGAVVIAGTGAVAARIENHSIVRVADGLGWLLGDEGSGHWLGMRALRAAVHSWPSPFAAVVAEQTGVGDRDQLILWAQGLPHARIAALAPVVCHLARAGDPHAATIVSEAVRALTATLDAVSPGGVVVLAGGLLTAETPVRDGLLAVLNQRGYPVLTSGDPAAAAAWLAVRELPGTDAETAHTALLAAA